MKIKFLVLFFLLAFSLTIPAQQTGLVAFDVLATKLERTHHVKLYYKSVWFEDKLFKETMAEMTLENALTIIKRSVHLNCIQMLSDCYVFVPEEVWNYSNNTNSNGVLLIGDGHPNGEQPGQDFHQRWHRPDGHAPDRILRCGDLINPHIIHLIFYRKRCIIRVASV